MELIVKAKKTDPSKSYQKFSLEWPEGYDPSEFTKAPILLGKECVYVLKGDEVPTRIIIEFEVKQ